MATLELNPNADLCEPEVLLLSHAEYKKAMQRVVEQSGFTFEQLQRQAEDNAFKTERARLAWLMVRD